VCEELRFGESARIRGIKLKKRLTKGEGVWKDWGKDFRRLVARILETSIDI